MSLKKELFIWADQGIVATFSKWVQKATEKNFVYAEVILLNSFPPKKVLIETGFHRDWIHYLTPSSSQKGVIDRIIFVYTAEPGSLIANILKSDAEKLIVELREKNRKLQMQVASSKQNEEDARSGVNKVIQSMKNVSKPSQSPMYDEYSQRHPQGQPQEGGSQRYNFDGFDEF